MRSQCLRFAVAVAAMMALLLTGAEARIRDYYVAAVEEEWDYAPPNPDEGDLVSYHPAAAGLFGNDEGEWRTFLEAGPQRIGRKYTKAMYREFTDATFSLRKVREEWMGLLGPVLVAEEGDTVRVTFKNEVSLVNRNFSMHPHGLQYLKQFEGALYVDGTGAAYKLDEGVGPGQTFVYEWNVTADSSPSADDPDCLTWTYHSHVDTVRDVNSGLIGALLTCRPGALATMTSNYAAQFTVLLDVMDENESWLLEHNMKQYLGLRDATAVEALKEDEGFQESNKMHGINGVLYGHLKGLKACVGTKVMWHLLGFGTEIDIHSLSISGHSFLHNQHREDALSLNPVDFVTAIMEVQSPGYWLAMCSVHDHHRAGMITYFEAQDCGFKNSSAAAMKVEHFRRYFLAIQEVDWDYGPGGNNLYHGGALSRPGSVSEPFFQADSTRVGGTYRKALFRQYTDMTYAKPTPRPAEEHHLGFLGPVIRVEVGDAVSLSLKNNASQPFSIHPHGASFVKMWEGALYNDTTGAVDHKDDFVEPGQVSTSYWFVPQEMGPGPLDPPCITRLYTSSSRDLERDSYSGLVGPILVCRKGALDSHDKQRQVDREFFVMASVTDENLSWYNDYNFRNLQVDRDDEDFYNANLMHSMNGYMYGTLPGLEVCEGDRVAWHVFGVGSERDVHGFYVHGQPLTLLDTRVSSTYLLPGYFRTLVMKAKNPGQWAVQCQTSDHQVLGEVALLQVSACGLGRDHDVQAAQRTPPRQYFLQAEEVIWDYAASGVDKISGEPLSKPDHQGHIFTTSEGPYLGTAYLKARYIQYTDASFTQIVPRAASDQYLGLLGPVITAEAYDTISVVFRNNASRPYSIHAQGLFFNKSSEGATYGGDDGAVQPGETRTYEWSVPAEFAPAEGDPDCINQAYYSAVDPVRDTYSGLIGPLVLCKPGILDSKGARTDVDQSFVLHFEVMDEARSWYIDNNIQMHGNSASRDDPEFGESSLMHSVNGYVYNNIPLLTMNKNDEVAWHLMSLGNEVDIHSIHFHGNEVRVMKTGVHHKDVTQLFPGIFSTVRMTTTMAGTWLLHCHVHDHLTAGMELTYTVAEPNANPFGMVGVN